MNPKQSPQKKNVSEIRYRLIKSLVTGFIFFSLVLFSFIEIKNDSSENEASFIIRKFFNFNEFIFSNLQSTNRLSVTKPFPKKGTQVRFNGDEGLTSDLELSTYKINISSGIQELSLTLSDITNQPAVEVSTDFKCIEGWSSVIHYKGLRFLDFMETYHVGKKKDGTYYKFVALETPDAKYYVSIDMASMKHAQTVLAYEMNQATLTIKNGAPLRLIIPIKYGIKSLKRIGRIYFTDEQPRDYWTEQGYDWFAGL
ncbi:MAG: molybdopterin-dependent oxidoreductase [Pseudobdellovibrio sp.]